MGLASSVVEFCSPLIEILSTFHTAIFNHLDHHTFKSAIDRPLTVATSALAHFRVGAATVFNFLQSRLPVSARPYISSVNNAHLLFPRPTSEYISTFVHAAWNQPIEIRILYLLGFILTAVEMSGWGRQFQRWGGRFSPFTGGSSGYPPQVSDGDFSYITKEDIATHQPYDPNSPKYPVSIKGEVDPRIGPDTILVRNRNTVYRLDFSTYSIHSDLLTVGDLRAEAARAVQISDLRRIKLLYKGRALKDDTIPCRTEDLKINSEVMCIVSEPLPSEEGESESGEDDLGMPQPEDGIPAKRKRIRTRKKKGKKSGTSTPDPSSNNLSPPTATGTATSRPTTPNVPPAQVVPKTPLEKLSEISSTLHTQFVPQCVQFTTNPPSDPTKRDYEHKKLGEMILAQVLLKLDAVETEGDPDARQRRKDLVKETQAVLNSLDAVMKGGTA